MAHYAILDEDNVVINVIVGRDETDKSHNWEEYYECMGGASVKRTSYNTHGGVHMLGGTPFRKNYAGLGYTYDETRDAFIPWKVYPSWILNEDSCTWDPPVPEPDTAINYGKWYEWNEETITWDEKDICDDMEQREKEKAAISYDNITKQIEKWVPETE
jgi:hypothetical protein